MGREDETRVRDDHELCEISFEFWLLGKGSFLMVRAKEW
jgi:hypothetical protein